MTRKVPAVNGSPGAIHRHHRQQGGVLPAMHRFRGGGFSINRNTRGTDFRWICVADCFRLFASRSAECDTPTIPKTAPAPHSPDSTTKDINSKCQSNVCNPNMMGY